MVASSQSSLVTNAATHGSAPSARHEAGSTQSSAPIGRGNLQANGQTDTLTPERNVSLQCVGSWTADKQSQDTDAALNDVRSDPTAQAACARHRNIQEACLDSTSNAQLIELLQESNTEGLATWLAGGEGDNPSLQVCTCDGIIEVD